MRHPLFQACHMPPSVVGHLKPDMPHPGAANVQTTITQICCVKTSVELYFFPEFEGMMMSVVYSQHPISTLSLHLKIPQ